MVDINRPALALGLVVSRLLASVVASSSRPEDIVDIYHEQTTATCVGAMDARVWQVGDFPILGMLLF